VLLPEDFTALLEHLEPVDFKAGQVLSPASEPVEHIYFPESGFSSMTFGQHDKVEVGLVGREGMTGFSIALGVRSVPFDCFIQLSGSGLRMPAKILQDMIEERTTLRRMLLRYAHVMYVQAAATAFVNVEHTVETRLARWLLMCHDRVDHNDISITHEFLSIMLGVRRAGVTSAIHVLEGFGSIQSTRGLITVRDRGRLEELADNSYGYPEAEYARLIVRQE
jgi:CRP-like cAMP-binding protein